jgi:hypothetical protein
MGTCDFWTPPHRNPLTDRNEILFIYLLTNAYKQLHLTRQKKKKTEHALGVTKGGKPPPTRHSRDKINTNNKTTDKDKVLHNLVRRRGHVMCKK